MAITGQRVEASMTLDGRDLTEGEVMTIRVALASFAEDMRKPGALGTDAHGRFMAESYERHASAVCAEMAGSANRRIRLAGGAVP